MCLIISSHNSCCKCANEIGILPFNQIYVPIRCYLGYANANVAAFGGEGVLQWNNHHNGIFNVAWKKNKPLLNVNHSGQ